MLESLGYSVSVHTKSLTALEEFTSNPGIYDLLVTDQTMPYMLGTELIRKVKELKPEIKTIIITGYGDSISEELKVMEKIDEVVIKPLILSNFSNLIRKVLDNNKKTHRVHTPRQRSPEAYGTRKNKFNDGHHRWSFNGLGSHLRTIRHRRYNRI